MHQILREQENFGLQSRSKSGSTHSQSNIWHMAAILGCSDVVRTSLSVVDGELEGCGAKRWRIRGGNRLF